MSSLLLHGGGVVTVDEARTVHDVGWVLVVDDVVVEPEGGAHHDPVAAAMSLQAAVVAALWGMWHAISGLALAVWWGRRPV